jgi:molybdenum cofactor synthesis domain-containing protein
LADAKALVDANIRPIERTETVQLNSLVHRVLAQELRSSIDVPPYNRSAMDGYAVKAEDTFSAGKFQPVELDCVGVVNAGEVPEGEVKKGICIQIATGAMIPDGADAVVIVENTERSGKKVQIYKSVPPGANVSKRGEDIKNDSVVLRAGEVLAPSKVGVLAALGIKETKVYSMPRVSVIPTGNEVAEVGKELRKGQVYDINSHTLSSILQENGCVPVLHRIVEDAAEALTSAFREASHSDMIVLSGGSSAGERDVLEGVVSKLGKVIFHGVQIKPGKPTIFGVIGKVPVFGMPGYPTSCLTNGYVFLLPAARKMARLPPKRDVTRAVPMAKKYAADIGRHQFLTVKIKDGEAHVVFKESGTITSIANADGWIEIPPNVDIVEKGTMVDVHLF